MLSGALLLLSIMTGCVHTIHVSPLPTTPTAQRISRTVQVIVGSPTIIGADHMPGIPLLEWTRQDLSRAVSEYLEKRESFKAVSLQPSDLSMTVATTLSMVSRERYRYRIRLQAEMKEDARPVKTYLSEHEAEGSSVRWVTASDREPIEAALQGALDELLTQIEADRALYESRPGRTTK